jgi:hypothetical protein
MWSGERFPKPTPSGLRNRHHNTVTAGVLALQLVRRFFWQCSVNLDRVERAVAEGKALNQLQDRLSRLTKAGEFVIPDVGRGGADADLHVDLVTPKNLTPEDAYFIRRTIREVNQREGTNIFINFLSSHSA